MAQLTPFDIGQIKAHLYHGLKGAAISRILLKPDGKSRWSETAIQIAVSKLESDDDWRGERETGTGLSRKTTKAQDKQIVKLVLDKRGKHKVTVAFVQRLLTWARKLSAEIIEDRLHKAGLEWLRRRKKTIVAGCYLKERVDYCEATIRKHDSTLLKWGYTDGTVWYLDRTEEENEHSQVAALGGWVWRRSDGSDALYRECLAPSSYKKGQGVPVRVWGVLAEGSLKIHILEEDEVMNAALYEELIEDHFESWLGSCCYLVCDFEACLRSEGPLRALNAIGVELVEGFPRCSQDFNAIEHCWKILRERLFVTMPNKLESRADFVERLKKAVIWMNRNRKNQLEYLSCNQKERCRASLATKPPGGRTKF